LLPNDAVDDENVSPGRRSLAPYFATLPTPQAQQPHAERKLTDPLADYKELTQESWNFLVSSSDARNHLLPNLGVPKPSRDPPDFAG
jgi:hypothetical protein